MPLRWIVLVTISGLLCANSMGCNKLPFGNKSADVEDFSDFEDFGDADAAGATAAADDKTHDHEHQHSETQAHAATPGAMSGAPLLPTGFQEPALTAAPGDFALQLPVGARFPLIKTISQRLTQQLPSGPVVGHTQLELRLSLLVEEQKEGARRISVRYHRVRYSQDLGGVAVEYDSDNPPTLTPPSALAYSGLKDNTFSFWLGADNRIGDLVGFQDFLRRCVAQIPDAQRTAVLNQLLAMGNEHGIANFIDDSIGLLPSPSDPQLAGKALQVGSSWTLNAAGKDSSTVGTRCLLKDLTPQTAAIALFGEIQPSNFVDDSRQMSLTVRGGQCTGHCVVDRQTGMPTQSRIDRRVDMVAKLPDGSEIPQTKEVITTVTAYLDQGSAAAPRTLGMAGGH